MRDKYVLVADEKDLKFFKLRKEQHENNMRITMDLIEDYENISDINRPSEIYSDKLGDFKNSNYSGGGTTELKTDLEMERQHIKNLAKKISEISLPEDAEVYLSAPQNILKRLESEISADARKKIKSSLGKNLVKVDIDKIMSEFGLK